MNLFHGYTNPSYPRRKQKGKESPLPNPVKSRKQEPKAQRSLKKSSLFHILFDKA